ncbi:tetratricopeptide repeat protein, partial [Lacticaseibacillus saniviri]
YEVSEQKLQTAARLAPDESVISFALGELYYAWGNYPAAQRAYQQVLGLGVEELAQVDVRARLASSVAQQGQYEEAIDLYEQIGLDKLDLLNQFQLGGLYLQVANYRDAITAFEAVIERDKTFASAYLPLATAQEKDHQEAAALTMVQEGVMVDDTNEDLFALGADLAIKEQDNDLAELYLQKALTIDPDNTTNQLAWSNFLLLNERDDENLAFLDDLLETADVDPQIYWNLAKSEARL